MVQSSLILVGDLKNKEKTRPLDIADHPINLPPCASIIQVNRLLKNPTYSKPQSNNAKLNLLIAPDIGHAYQKFLKLTAQH